MTNLEAMSAADLVALHGYAEARTKTHPSWDGFFSWRGLATQIEQEIARRAESINEPHRPFQFFGTVNSEDLVLINKRKPE